MIHKLYILGLLDCFVRCLWCLILVGKINIRLFQKQCFIFSSYFVFFKDYINICVSNPHYFCSDETACLDRMFFFVFLGKVWSNVISWVGCIFWICLIYFYLKFKFYCGCFIFLQNFKSSSIVAIEISPTYHTDIITQN